MVSHSGQPFLLREGKGGEFRDRGRGFEFPNPPRLTLASLPSLTKQSFHPRTLGWATAISCRSHVAQAPFLLPAVVARPSGLLFRKTASKQANFSICDRRNRKAPKCAHVQCWQCKCKSTPALSQDGVRASNLLNLWSKKEQKGTEMHASAVSAMQVWVHCE